MRQRIFKRYRRNKVEKVQYIDPEIWKAIEDNYEFMVSARDYLGIGFTSKFDNVEYCHKKETIGYDHIENIEGIKVYYMKDGRKLMIHPMYEK